jgi:DNA-binding transcriptional regulator LsrR (DeoR family)
VTKRTSETLLITRVARLYYLEDQSKSAIAQELGMSRFRVARLLESARREGIVNIEIRSNGSVDTSLSLRLQSAWGLRHCVVLDVPEDDDTQLRTRLGEAAAALLLDVVTPVDVLGMAWSRSLSAVGDALTTFVPCHVVQLTGALSRPDGSDILGLVRRVAVVGRGTPHVFYAPMVMPDAASARVLRRQPDVIKAAALVPKVTVAVVGVGAWQAGLSTIYDSVPLADRDRVTRAGVIAEISGVFVNATGQTVTPPLSGRIMGVTGEQLRQVTMVLAIAYGEAKTMATAAALRSGLIDGLVTHAGVARRLIELADGLRETAELGEPASEPVPG